MTDLYDIELWNAEGTNCDHRVVNSSELVRVIRNFKCFVTWSSLSILKVKEKVCNESFTGDPVTVGSDECDSCLIQLGQDGKSRSCKNRL